MRWHRAIVLAYIAANGPVRLRQISAALGLDLTTLGTIMGELRCIKAVSVDPEQFITARRTPRQRAIDRASVELQRQGFDVHPDDDGAMTLTPPKRWQSPIDLGALVDAVTASH